MSHTFPVTRTYQDLASVHVEAQHQIYRAGTAPWSNSAASSVLALVHRKPGHAPVGIRNHPATSRERRRDESLAPLEGVFGACRYDGYPHQQREHAHLQRRECGCQPCIHADEHRHARRDEGTASEIGPGHMPWQPAWHQRNGILEIEEMSKAEEDQRHAVEHSRDAEAFFPGDETETLPVPFSGEPCIQDPRTRHHLRSLKAGPENSESGREDDVWHSEQQQPKQETGEQHTGSGGGSALPEQAYASCERDERAKIGQSVRILGYGIPHWGEVAFDQANHSDGNHDRRKDHVTHARDAHRPILRWCTNSSGTCISCM